VSTPLSSLLREGTREKHRLAEEAPFVRALLAGRVLHGAYACLLQSLRFIYSEMEAVLDGRFDLPGLRRLPALEEDLSWWSPYERPTPSPATRAYVERIRACSPAQRVGHFYTRYLGDLYGGEVLMRAVARTFGLSHEGLAFYRFDDRVQLRQRFREALDGVEVDAATSERIVAEACRAFDHNARLFEELT
jgi:heme oxygenase